MMKNSSAEIALCEFNFFTQTFADKKYFKIPSAQICESHLRKSARIALCDYDLFHADIRR